MPKRITIDDLARMVQKGFHDIDVRFASVDQRLEKIETRLGGIDVRLDRIENVLIGGLANRLDRAEDDIRVLKTKSGIR